ncbi:hypothetical protein GKQ38_05225 [Candidatus Nanohaloarchaea archaeon]|nr:hypothetical protein GKQ38_05225 [Candidatus Nanohaloarchaea archaeon]
MRRKGISGVVIMAVVSLFGLGIIIGVTQGSAGGTLDFVKAQSVNLQAERVTNAMLIMETVPEGYVQLKLDEYQIRYDENDRNLSLNYSGKVGSNVVKPYMTSYDQVIAPSTFQPINGSLCIRKEHRSGQSVLILNRTGCSS